MNISKRRILMNPFSHRNLVIAQFIWMYCNRTNNEKINRLYERCLRIIYQDKQSFEEREEDHSLTIHQRNLQYFLIEIQKKRNSISCLYKRILYAK